MQGTAVFNVHTHLHWGLVSMASWNFHLHSVQELGSRCMSTYTNCSGLCVQKHLWFYHGLPITEITILTITLLMISVLYTVSLISSTSVHLSLQMCFILTLGKSFIWNIFLSILKENKQGLFCRYFALRLALFSIPFALQASRFWDLHSLEKFLFIKHKKLDPIMLSVWVQSQCCSRPRSPKAHTGWHFIMSEAPTACSYLCSRCLLQPILVIV